MSEPPRGTATTSALRGRPASRSGGLVAPGLRSENRRLTVSRLRLSTRHYIVRRWDPACLIRRWDRASAAPALDLASEKCLPGHRDNSRLSSPDPGPSKTALGPAGPGRCLPTIPPHPSTYRALPASQHTPCPAHGDRPEPMLHSAHVTI